MSKFYWPVRVPYSIMPCRGDRHLPGLPNELEDGDEAGETHPGEQHDEDATDVGQTQLARLRFIVVVLKPLMKRCSAEKGAPSMKGRNSDGAKHCRQNHVNSLQLVQLEGRL